MSYLRREQLVLRRVLCKTRLIFPRINGPDIEGRKAFMRNKVEFHDKKNGKKSNVLLIESTPHLSVCHCYLFIYFSCRV